MKVEASLNHWSVLMRRKWTVLITTLCAAFIGFSVACFRTQYYSRVIVEIEQEPPVCGMGRVWTVADFERNRLRAERAAEWKRRQAKQNQK